MKQFVGYLIKKAVGKGKVSPTIKSVKPSPTVMKKGAQASVDKVKSNEYTKRIRLNTAAEDKIKTGKKLVREGVKARENLVDTRRAFKFKGSSKSYPVDPKRNPQKEYQNLDLLKKDKPPKKFKKGKELEKKANGGRIGRRFGSPKPKTNVEKIKETFAPRNKNLKPVDPKKQKGLSKLPSEVRNKMGYMKSGGRAGFKDGTSFMGTRSGGTRPRPGENLDPNNSINKRKKEFKQEAKKDMK